MSKPMSTASLPSLVALATLLGYTAACPVNCVCSTTSAAVCYGSRDVGHLPLGLQPGITSLALHHFNLTRLAADSLADLPSLLQLQLQDCVLYSLHPAAFQALVQIRSLGIQDNYLEHLDPDMFLYNTRLMYLDLSGNYLHAPDNMALLNSQSLQELNVSYCHLDYLPDEAFQGLPELRVLHLEGNYLHLLRMRQLAPMQHLTHLHLQNNKINILLNKPSSPLLASLEYVDLSNNLLTAVDITVVQVAVALRQLELRNNPLMCNCHLAAASTWLRERRVTAPGYCAAPYHMIATDWRDLSALTCDIGVSSQYPAAQASSYLKTSVLPLLVVSINFHAVIFSNY